MGASSLAAPRGGAWPNGPRTLHAGWCVHSPKPKPRTSAPAICARCAPRAHLTTPQAIPRLTSKGTLCGAVYKVASAQKLAEQEAQQEEEEAAAARRRQADGATRVHVL